MVLPVAAWRSHGNHYGARLCPLHRTHGGLAHPPSRLPAQVYQKERHEFGRAVMHFAATEVSILDEFYQDEPTKKDHIERCPTILDIQAIPEMSETFVNTETVTYKAQGMLHAEGGWPKDVDATEKDQTQCVHCSRTAVGRVQSVLPLPWSPRACTAPSRRDGMGERGRDERAKGAGRVRRHVRTHVSADE